MKNNVFEEAYEMLQERIGDTFKELRKDFKNVKPFAKETIKQRDVEAYLNLDMNKVNQMIKTMGMGEFQKYQQTMEAELRRR